MLFSAFLPQIFFMKWWCFFMAIDIFSIDCAEALFHFVGQTDVFEDFCLKSFEYDLSIAEYVQNYKLEEFTVWYAERGEFDAVLP